MLWTSTASYGGALVLFGLKLVITRQNKRQVKFIKWLVRVKPHHITLIF